MSIATANGICRCAAFVVVALLRLREVPWPTHYILCRLRGHDLFAFGPDGEAEHCSFMKRSHRSQGLIYDRNDSDLLMSFGLSRATGREYDETEETDKYERYERRRMAITASKHRFLNF